jgi:hypothetical protein
MRADQVASAHSTVAQGIGRVRRPQSSGRNVGHRTRNGRVDGVLALTGRLRSRSWPVALIVALAGGTLAGCSSGRHLPSPRPFHPEPVSASAPLIDRLAQGSKVAFGVQLDDLNSTSLAAFAQLAGAHPQLVSWSQQWSEPLYYPEQLRAVLNSGAVPMITWDPTDHGLGIPLADIADGRYDRYIRSAAAAAAGAGAPIMVRFAHEMNLHGSPFGPGKDGNTPAAYVAAWRHVVSMFRAAGATNVRWVWSPNTYCSGHCPFTAFYPGDKWVDWVGLDGYNYAAVDGIPWYSFKRIFSSSYAILSHLTAKPMMVGETGSTDLGGSKAGWIRGMAAALATSFKHVRALVWFQRIKETDWRINSSPSSLAAFRAILASPLFLH